MPLSGQYLSEAARAFPDKYQTNQDEIEAFNKSPLKPNPNYVYEPEGSSGGEQFLPRGEAPAPQYRNPTFLELASTPYSGRRGNVNPAGSLGMYESMLGKGKNLGLGTDQVNEAISGIANAHMSKFGQFYDEASSPFILQDMFQQALAQMAGKPYTPLSPEDTVRFQSQAQTVQEDYKSRDKRITDIDDYNKVKDFGTFAFSAVGIPSPLQKLFFENDPNKPDNPDATSSPGRDPNYYSRLYGDNTAATNLSDFASSPSLEVFRNLKLQRFLKRFGRR